jgi:protein O-GlcNAc transferase
VATDAWYSEKLVRLPGTFLCYHEDRRSPPVQPPPCIDAGYITFGSFNAVPKISDMTARIWADVLRQTSGSRLLLKTRGLSDETQRARLHALFAAQGIDPQRIEMIEKIPAYDEHLDAYNRVDIALETFPYNGTTTTCEALWMGVPVLTLGGKVHVSRVGLTLLTAVGLPELIAFSPEEYVKKATALAADVEKLKELRTSLRSRMQSSRLMDAPRFAANVEAAYRTMWRTWCGQKKAGANV